MYTIAPYGGTIPWVAIHGIDWIYWYSSGRITEVSASQTTPATGHGEMESSGACLMRLGNAGCASLTFDTSGPAPPPRMVMTAADCRGEGRGGGDRQRREHQPPGPAPRKLEKEEPVSMFQSSYGT